MPVLQRPDRVFTDPKRDRINLQLDLLLQQRRQALQPSLFALL
jgi:hypothetical protein